MRVDLSGQLRGLWPRGYRIGMCSTLDAGCLAMGDEASEDLFALAAAVGIRKITVIIAPTDFRLTMPDTAERDQASRMALGWRGDSAGRSYAGPGRPGTSAAGSTKKVPALTLAQPRRLEE